jgi:hypothetical protein
MSLEAPTQGEVKSLLWLLPQEFTKGDAIEASKQVWKCDIAAKRNLLVIWLLERMWTKEVVKKRTQIIEKNILPRPRMTENELEVVAITVYAKRG